MLSRADHPPKEIFRQRPYEFLLHREFQKGRFVLDIPGGKVRGLVDGLLFLEPANKVSDVLRRRAAQGPGQISLRPFLCLLMGVRHPLGPGGQQGAGLGCFLIEPALPGAPEQPAEPAAVSPPVGPFTRKALAHAPELLVEQGFQNEGHGPLHRK